MSEHTESRSESREDDFAAGEVSASANGLPPIALLYTDDALLAHVDEALTAMSARVVYRAALASADQDALVKAQPAIALINLDDGGCDERLDAVAAWLDGARVPIVFNDAEISRGLEGFARARWARHLAAKLRGSEDVYPPRPANASQEFPPSGLRPPSPASGGREDSPQVISDAPVAARPLTANEIESLVADFPSEHALTSEDTATLAAHVDALLANAAEESTASEPASWEIIAPLESAPAPTAVAANESASATAPATAPGFGDWQLVDDPAPVVSAPREKPAEAATAVTFADFDFDLEPIEHAIPMIVREREAEEMRLEGDTVGRAGQKK